MWAGVGVSHYGSKLDLFRVLACSLQHGRFFLWYRSLSDKFTPGSNVGWRLSGLGVDWHFLPFTLMLPLPLLIWPPETRFFLWEAGSTELVLDGETQAYVSLGQSIGAGVGQRWQWRWECWPPLGRWGWCICFPRWFWGFWEASFTCRCLLYTLQVFDRAGSTAAL